MIIFLPQLYAAPASPLPPRGTAPLGSFRGESIASSMLNPAYSKSDSFSIYMDLGLLMYGYGSTIDGHFAEIRPDDELLHPYTGSYDTKGSIPVPSLALALPLGKKWGLGLTTWIPVGTSGSYPDDAPQRLWAIDGQVTMVEQAAALSYTLSEHLSIGASFRTGWFSLRSFTAMDTGLLLYETTQDKSLLLEPFLEGEQRLQAEDVGFSGAAGLYWKKERYSLHASYRAPVSLQPTGSADALISKDLNLSLTGALALQLTLPGELLLGGSFRWPNWQLHLDGGWIDFHRYRYLTGELTNLTLTSESAFFQAFLEEYGLTTAEVFTADQQLTRDLGHQDLFYQQLWVSWSAHRPFVVAGGVLHSSGSIPSTHFTPANFNFPVTVLQGSLGWVGENGWQFFLAGEHHLINELMVTHSLFDPEKSSDSGLQGYPATGSYRFAMNRIGLSLLFQH